MVMSEMHRYKMASQFRPSIARKFGSIASCSVSFTADLFITYTIPAFIWFLSVDLSQYRDFPPSIKTIFPFTSSKGDEFDALMNFHFFHYVNAIFQR